MKDQNRKRFILPGLIILVVGIVGTLVVFRTNAATSSSTNMPTTVWEVMQYSIPGLAEVVTVSTKQSDFQTSGGGMFAAPVFLASDTAGEGLIPIYRLRQPLNGRVLLTKDDAERTKFVNEESYRDEGVAFYAAANQVSGLVAVDRYESPQFGYRYVLRSVFEAPDNEALRKELSNKGYAKVDGAEFYVTPL